MRALHLNLQESSLESLAATEWTLSQARSIMILAQVSEPLPINELATRLRLSVAATGRNVDQLVNQGLVDRQEDPRDRRIKRVSLTPQGRAQVAHAHTIKRASMSAFLDRLEPEDHERLLAALAPIQARLEPTIKLQKRTS
ncbi:DNA-binding MarR family transcriptional regulator [Antricoccus suffuscus]|uniref:DNA-binding MarR family transcriptional regulator n=2 Tax=Antricoccus suffuscus TaxID=1629062 RepID=A0A2T1A1X7_9ACTN|nr:DNA-binding MarR family transcriptional regulator [Antricoccus suffuscus]